MDERLKLKLTELGIDLNRTLECVNGNEELYIKLLKMFLNDDDFSVLKESMETHNIKSAFDSGHALKGLAGNLGLNHIYKALCELVDIYRAGNEAPMESYYQIQKMCVEINEMI